MRKMAVIYNPVATGMRKLSLERVRKLFSKRWKTDLLESKKAGDTPILVRKANEDYDWIVTMGGDGTMGEAVRALNKVPQHGVYSHIPVGTTKKKKTTIPDYSEISDSEKRTAIFSTLKSITKNPFRIGKYNNVEFNPNCFPFPISSEQQEKLEKYMDRRTQKNCYYYIRYNSMIEEENKKGFSVCYELYEDRDAEARSLRTKFKSSVTLNKAYAWCVAYNECLVQQQETN